MDYQTTVEHPLKRSRPFGISDEVLISFCFFFIVLQLLKDGSQLLKDGSIYKENYFTE